MTSPTTEQDLYARYANKLAYVLDQTAPDYDKATLTPESFTDQLDTAAIYLAQFRGSLADVADDITTALSYLADAHQETDPAAREVLMRQADKRLQGLFFAADDLVC